jgi:hypothetical protein
MLNVLNRRFVSRIEDAVLTDVSVFGPLLFLIAVERISLVKLINDALLYLLLHQRLLFHLSSQREFQADFTLHSSSGSVVQKALSILG